MDPLRQSDIYADRYSIGTDETIQAEAGHRMTFDDTLRSSLGSVGDPMYFSTGRKLRMDIPPEESLLSSQMSTASVQSTSSLGILQLDSMADLSASFLQLDGSFNQPRFSNGFQDGEGNHAGELNSDFEPGERGNATGGDSMGTSEIDTEDELDAVRRENARRQLYPTAPVDRESLHAGDGGESSDSSDDTHHSRPGLEGGSSDEHNSTLPSSPQHLMSLRQSAEGEVVTSPLLGDGGGGGDGMSDGETGSSLTAPSVVSGGAGGRPNGGNRRVFFRSWSNQSGFSDQDRNIEGSILNGPHQTPTPEMSCLAPHFLLPTAHPQSAGSATDLTNSPELRPLSSASSFHFEEGAFGSSQEGLHQRFWNSGMLEGPVTEEERRGNGEEEEEEEEEEGDAEKTLIPGSERGWHETQDELDTGDVNTERDILQIQEMMRNFEENSPPSQGGGKIFNPFDNTQDDDALGGNVVGFSDFDGEFLGQDDAAALLAEDQEAFEKENQFRQDEHISSDQFSIHNASSWTLSEKSHLTIQDQSEVQGDDSFDRASLGAFMRTRTEALGSLSGDTQTIRPNFGTGHIKTPEGKDPVALMDVTRLSLVAEEEERDRVQGIMGMTELGESIRFSGVGSDTEDHSGRHMERNQFSSHRVSQPADTSSSSFAELEEYAAGRESLPMASLYLRVANPEGSDATIDGQTFRPSLSIRSVSDDPHMASLNLEDLSLADNDGGSRGNSRFIRSDEADQVPVPQVSRVTPTSSPLKPNLKVQPFQDATTPLPRQIAMLREESEPDGIRTPPIATSAIAAAIASASSCTKPEELAAMVLALSRKQRNQQSSQDLKQKSEPVVRSKSVDALNDKDTLYNKSPRTTRNSPKSHTASLNVQDSSNMGPSHLGHSEMLRKVRSSPKATSNVPGTLVETERPRNVAPGTESIPYLQRINKIPPKSMDSEMQELTVAPSHERLARTSEGSTDLSRPDSLKKRTYTPLGETLDGAASKKRSSSYSGTNSTSKEKGISRQNTSQDYLENSVMNEVRGFDLSFDSRMRVHTERLKSIQRAQELEAGTRSAGRDSLESLDSDTLISTPRSSDENRDTEKKPRKQFIRLENTDEGNTKASSGSRQDLEHKFQGQTERMEDTKLTRRSSPRNSPNYIRNRNWSRSPRRVQEPEGMKLGVANHKDSVTKERVSSNQQDLNSPSRTETASHLTNGHSKRIASKARSPGRGASVSPRESRHENILHTGAQNGDSSSDDENDALSRRPRSRNYHKPSRRTSQKTMNEEVDKLPHPQQTPTQMSNGKPSSPSLKQTRTYQTPTEDFRNKAQLEVSPDPSTENISSKVKSRLSASPDTPVTPGANKISVSPRSASSSFSESATQTSDNDTQNVTTSNLSQPPTSLQYGPPISSFQAFPDRPRISTHSTSTTPTLLTSQSLLTDALLKQYLNEQAVTSRPANTLSVAPSYVSGQLMKTLDAIQKGTNLQPTLVSATNPPYVSSQPSDLGLIQTFPNLTINTAQTAPSLSRLQRLDSSTHSPNLDTASHPLLTSTRDLGPMLDRVSLPGQTSLLGTSTSFPTSASHAAYPSSATMPVLPLQSTHTIPSSVYGFGSLTAGSFASLPSFQGAAIQGYPVNALPSRPVTAQDHAIANVGPPQPMRVTAQAVNPVVVGSINIKGVCCLGIAKQALLPLQNHGPRWLQCHMEVTSVSVNGEELPPDSLSSFLVKRRTIISPHHTEEVKIVFVPHQPGIYVAQIQVSSSPVVAEGEVASLSQGVPVTVLARAEKPNVGVKGAQNGTLDLGVLSYGKERSAPIYLVNKGSSRVPLQLLIKVNSSAWHSFYLHTGDSTKNNPEHSSGLNLPTHVTLEGQNDTVTLWVHLRATQRDKAASPGALGAPEQVSAKMEVWLDVPDGGVAITSVALRATVGLAKLNIPRALTKEITFKSHRGEHTGRMLPLKNTGNIHLDTELSVLSAQGVFTVVPQTILLAPGQEVNVLVKYTPKEVPSQDTGQLTMCARPDGPSYEVMLRGEAVEKTMDNNKPNFLVNRHFISWGGVPIGRALQQKLTIRSCTKEDELKLRLYISGAKAEFQLLNAFGSGEWSTDTNQYVTLKPQEDMLVHILFSPTAIATSQAKLSIKPQNSNFKYNVPLSGYGGVSKLIVEDLHEAEHGCYGINVGHVTSTNNPIVCRITVSNVGRRSAFVKAIGFQDDQGRDKLRTSQLRVEPDELILPEKHRKTLTVTLHTNKMDIKSRPLGKEGILAAIGLFYGDEISRQQYRRALRRSDSEEVGLSTHNPLRDVTFDRPFTGEAKVNEVNDLPWRSGDLNLFYCCVSRVMVLLKGRMDQGESMASNQRPSLAPLSPVRSSVPSSRDEDRLASAGQSNRPVTVAYTPPVKGTPAPRQASSAQLSPTRPSRTASASDVVLTSSEGRMDSWSVQPHQMVITAPGAGVGVQKSHSIRIANHSPRKLRIVRHCLKNDSCATEVVPRHALQLAASMMPVKVASCDKALRFETMHTPDCLIVTPAAGVVEPMSQLLVLVSCNPSIRSRGVQLPWSGAILVVCDDQKQEVKVQIREDFGMDSSIIPSMGRMQSLSDQPVTPDTSMVAAPSETTSPVKLQSKAIRFPTTVVGNNSEATLEFQNNTSEPRQWCLSSFAPTYVKQDSGEIYRATYSAFRFTRQYGNLEPGQNIAVNLEFIPRDEGMYSQYWDLESNRKSTLANGSHKTRIELVGQGSKGEAASSAPAHHNTKKKKKKNHHHGEGNLVRVEPLVNSKPTALAVPILGDNSSEGDISPADSKKEPAASRSPDSTSVQGVTLIDDHLIFRQTKVGSAAMLKVQVQNSSTQTHTVKFVSPQAPFSIRHQKHTIQPKRFIRLPVYFKPTVPGKHQAALVITLEGHHNLMSRLEGIGV